MGACVAVRSARADDCASVESRAALAELSGVRIASVDVQSESPDMPAGARFLNAVHPASRPSTLRRQLLFAPGDTVDTLLVAETLRRLRRQRLFSDAVVLARRCDSGSVALTLRTRDSWSLRPMGRLRSSRQLAYGIEERNLLGTGRAVTLTHEVSTRGQGAALAVTDPFVLGTDLAATVRVSALAGARHLRVALRNHEYSAYEPWRIEARLARLSYGDSVATDRALQNVAAMLQVGRRVGTSLTSVDMLLAGAEFDSAAGLSRARAGNPAGAMRTRSYVGVNVGLLRRATAFDTATWIVPGRGFLDLPLGWEGEVTVGGGYARGAHAPALRFDMWEGRMWVPRRGSLLTLDAWASGYAGRGVQRNQILRASLSWFAGAAGGMWGLRTTVEQLREVDPDRRGLSLMPQLDVTAPALLRYQAHGGKALAASVERSMHVRQMSANSVLDLGGFLGSSRRWDVDNARGQSIAADVLGVRLRLLSAHGAVSSIRLDVGYPVNRSALVPNRGFVILQFGSLVETSRQRDGRRIY